MNNIWIIAVIILGMLVLERLSLMVLTSRGSGREFLRRHVIFHPNAISVMRLPMGIISTCLAWRGYWSAATLFFAFWMISDLSDGTIARRCDLGSETGKWLDPLSDKMMYFPVLFFFAFADNVKVALSVPLVIAFIFIDILGQASRLFVKKKAANQFGKAKTALTTILISLLALNEIDNMVIMNQTLANGLMWTIIILAFLSCYCKIIPDHWYANTLTLANFICGIAAIFHAFDTKFIHCMVFVFIGQFFDLFDGRMARKYGSTKRGALFDDIADATSFGIAIGSMVFICFKNMLGKYPIWIFAIVALFYLFCVIYRLYRFMKPTMPLPKGVFQGLPSPAGAMFAGASVLVARELGCEAAGFVAVALVVCAALLMISNIPYCHFGQMLLPAMPKFIKMMFLLLFIVFTVTAIAQKSYRASFVWCLFGFTLCYLIYGIHWINRLTPPLEDAKN